MEWEKGDPLQLSESKLRDEKERPRLNFRTPARKSRRRVFHLDQQNRSEAGRESIQARKILSKSICRRREGRWLPAGHGDALFEVLHASVAPLISVGGRYCVRLRSTKNESDGGKSVESDE